MKRSCWLASHSRNLWHCAHLFCGKCIAFSKCRSICSEALYLKHYLS